MFGPKGDVDGRVVGLTADAIELDVDGHRERVVAVDIGWIERIGDPVLEGVFIGGGLAAALFSQLATYECSSGCGRKRAEGALWGVAIGGLVGGLIDGAGAQRRVVYGSRQPTPERALPVAAAPSTPRSEPPPLARRAERATSTADLWTVVRTDDRVTVSLVDGEQLHGRFRRASSDSVTVAIGDVSNEISTTSIARIARVTNRKGLGMGIGAAAGALSGLISESEGGGDVIGGAIPGLLLGGVVGLMVSKTTTVYTAPPADAPALDLEFRPQTNLRSRRTVVLGPLLHRRTVGVGAMLSW